MKNSMFALFVFFFLSTTLSAQTKYQYFDGADTMPHNSLFVTMDTTMPNVWQVGKPQKAIFDSAATFPNAIITDTLNPYPVNDSSSFVVRVSPYYGWGVFAFQWKQKLDFEYKSDGGVVEFSLDTGRTWYNIF